MPKLPVILVIISRETLTRTNVTVPSVISVLLHHNTVTNVDEISAAVTGPPARSSDSCFGWFVWNQLPRARVGNEA